jgi:tRNA threonylcarbamoyladenosine biosynthesis protein TsaB
VLLALDTSTAAVTVAVLDGADVAAEAVTVDARRHTELLAPMIVQVLSDAAVDRTALTAVAVGVGPGPFTGLRIGLATARTLGAALNIPVHGVCSLDVIAADVAVDTSFVVVTDARRREVFWAEYDGLRRTAGPAVVPPGDVATDRPAAGAGARLFHHAFANPVDPEFPSAATLGAMIADGTADVVAPEPLYLRRPDARPPGQRKPVLAR